MMSNLMRRAEDCSPYQFDRAQPSGYNACESFFPEMTSASIASSQKRVFIAKNSSATYQRDMRESLRKISQLTLCARIVFFREQSKIVAHIKQPLEQFACFFFSAEQMPAIRQPKGAGKKYSFVARQSVHARFLRPIAQHETILHQFAFNCLNRAANTFVSDRQKIGERHCKEACVQCIRPVHLRESFL